jgi:two-component system cell cycle sensor histidine kinase PleC
MAWAGAAQASSWIRSRWHAYAQGDLRLQGHVRLLAGPTYFQLCRLEPILKRSIPILIIAFISYIAVSRGVALFDEYQTHETHARAEVAMTGATIAAVLGRADAKLTTGGPAQALRATLANAVPPSASSDDKLVLLVDPAGRVVATAPQVRHWEGRALTDLIGTGQPLSVYGARAGVMELRLATGRLAFVGVNHIEDKLGSVAVIHLSDAVFAGWRAHFGNAVLAFAFTALILLVLTYAYFAQVERAAVSDDLHKDAKSLAETAFKRGRCGLWDWDLSRGKVFWAESMFEMLGLHNPTGLIGFGDMCKLVHPADVDLAGLAERLLSGRQHTVDQALRLKSADGQWLWFRVRAEVVERADTGQRHLIGIASDITEQRIMAERTATADLRLRDAIETISEAFVLWDAENRLVMCNSKYQQLHHLGDDAVQPGLPYAEVMAAARQHVVHSPVAVDPGDGSGASGRTYEAQIEGGRWLQINERRTKDGGFVSVGTDITQLKRHEERLTESEKRLMGTVLDLRQSRQTLERQTQELVEMAEKYAEEKVRAEEANRIKSDFLANISHELRTPLNAIIGFSDIMTRGVTNSFGPQKFAEYARDIHTSGTFLLNVINDILDMSRIEAGAMELEPEEIDLAGLLTEATRVVAPVAAEKNIEISAELTEAVRIVADRRALKQILLNLLSNAMKFTPPGGRVLIRGKAVGDRVAITIRDTGIGIPADQIRKLGRPFMQVANQFTKTHRGSGLGLAIARSLVFIHGGQMRIASTVGRGTAVSMRLPSVVEARPLKVAAE